jgi:hypothetical protein
VTSFNLATSTKEIMFVFAPADVTLSTYIWNESGSSKCATIFKNARFDIELTIFDIDGNPPVPGDFTDGPTGWRNRYGDRRKFFPVGPTSYVWQDKSSKCGKLTTFEGTTLTTVDLEVDADFVLASATAGQDGEIFYFLVQDGCANDKVTPRDAFLVRAKTTGEVVMKKPVDTTKEGLNIYELAESCNLTLNNESVL